MSTITETRPTLPAGTWNVDPVHSTVGFAVDYIVGTFNGSFSPVDAKLEVTEDGERLTGSAPVTGVKVQDENLAAHLQSPDFLDAERAPEITFESTAIRRDGERVEIDGDLTIKGVTLPVRAAGTVTEPADDPFGGVRFALKLETAIDRTRYGVSWNNPLPNGKPSLADQVRIGADLYLVRAEA
jgi:polyisoprenoid-binding protein YceI